MPLEALAVAFEYHLRFYIKTAQYSKRYTDHFHFTYIPASDPGIFGRGCSPLAVIYSITNFLFSNEII